MCVCERERGGGWGEGGRATETVTATAAARATATERRRTQCRARLRRLCDRPSDDDSGWYQAVIASTWLYLFHAKTDAQRNGYAQAAMRQALEALPALPPSMQVEVLETQVRVILS